MGRHIVFGLGETGNAFARYLTDKHIPFEVADSRESPRALAGFEHAFPNVQVHLGAFSELLYEDAEVFYMSPGLDPNIDFFKQARARGIKLCGDVELFKSQVTAPIVAITGTNGKSTVTAWLNHVGQLSDKTVLMGGNI